MSEAGVGTGPSRRSSLSRPPQPGLGADPAVVSTSSRRGGRLLQVCVGLLVLAVLAWQLGTGPFLDGLRATEPWAVLVALVVAAGDDVVRGGAVVAGLGAGRERVPARTAYVRLLPLTAAQRHAARWRGRRRAPGCAARRVRAGRGRGSGSAVRAGWVQHSGPWLGALLLPGRRGAGVGAGRGGARGCRGRRRPAALRGRRASAGRLPCSSSPRSRPASASESPPARRRSARSCCSAPAIPLSVAGWGPREGVAAWAFAAFRARRATAWLTRGRRTACWRWSRRCPARVVLAVPGWRSAPWLSVPTPCSAAACRSTATSTTPGDERLLLSNDADLDRVDEVRAGSDAILVGAARSATTTRGCWCAAPAAAGAGVPRGGPRTPVKVTVTERGPAGPGGEVLRRRRRREARLLPLARPCAVAARAAGAVATVVDAGRPVRPAPGRRGPARRAASAG